MKIEDLSANDIKELATLALQHIFLLSIITEDELSSVEYTKEELINYLENVRTRRIKEAL